MKDYVSEKKIDQHILRNKYHNVCWKGTAGKEGYNYKIDFVLSNGDVISNAVIIGSYITSNYGKVPVVDKKAEKIIDAIYRLGILGQIKQIIVNRNGYRNYNNQRKHWTEKTIYRME